MFQKKVSAPWGKIFTSKQVWSSIIISEFALGYSGTVFDIANTLAMATGFVAPVIVGAFINENVKLLL